MAKRKHKRSGISGLFSVILVGLIIVLVLFATTSYDIYNKRERLKAEARELQAQEDALNDRKNQLEAQSGRSSAADIEDAAREQLDMVYPGEIIFRTTGD